MGLMDTIKLQALAAVVKLLFSMLTPEKMKMFLEKGLDGLEEYCAKPTTNHIVSQVGDGLCRIIRDFLNMPDDDLVGSEHENVVKFVDGLFASMDFDGLVAFFDKGLDSIEDYVEGTKTKWDDLIVLPLCKLVRTVGRIPDNDDVADNA